MTASSVVIVFSWRNAQPTRPLPQWAPMKSSRRGLISYWKGGGDFILQAINRAASNHKYNASGAKSSESELGRELMHVVASIEQFSLVQSRSLLIIWPTVKGVKLIPVSCCCHSDAASVSLCCLMDRTSVVSKGPWTPWPVDCLQ